MHHYLISRLQIAVHKSDFSFNLPIKHPPITFSKNYQWKKSELEKSITLCLGEIGVTEDYLTIHDQYIKRKRNIQYKSH